MFPTLHRLRWPFGLLVLVITIVPLRGQSLLYADLDGTLRLVRRVRDNTPFVDDGHGKLVAAESRFSLRPVPEYLPVVVSVRDLQLRGSARRMRNGTTPINREFHVSADFESPVALDNVYFVLDLNAEIGGRGMFVQQIGNLAAHESRHIDLVAHLDGPLGGGKYQLHIFADGPEVLNSKLTPERIGQALDQIVHHRIQGVANAAPQPLVSSAPAYPRQLRKAKLNGRAVITVKIATTGQVTDVAVKSATDPAFGTAALAAAKEWRFVPRVVNGTAMESTVDVPFDFNAAPAK